MKQLFLIGLSLIIAFFYANNTQAQFGLKFEIGIGGYTIKRLRKCFKFPYRYIFDKNAV